METGLVFDKHGNTIHWHVPADRSQGYLPDSPTLWQILWENREQLGGVAHTHPWHGAAGPSSIDLTTFAAIEEALGQRLVWPIVTFSEVGFFEWVGPERLDYAPLAQRRFRIPKESIEELRDLSR